MLQIALVAYAARKLGTSRFFGVARVAAYGGVVAVAVGGFGMHKARAAAAETGLRIGDDLAAVAPMLQGANTLNVNGQRVHFGAAATLDGAKVVLDKFEASCQTGAGGNAAVWEAIPNPEDIKDAKIEKMPIFRSEKGPNGFIACLVPVKGQDPTAFMASVKNFFDNHASLQIGKLRYANVHESATGSTVTTVWTDDNFDLAALIPDGSHDSPGIDPAVMMRPDNTVRMLSGVAEGMPYKAFLYESKQSPKEALDSYETKMIAAGWVSIAVPQMAVTRHDGFEAHSYMRNGFIGYLTASKSPTGSTLIGIGETASPAPDKKSSTMVDSDGF
jgi:hypothetical protein